MKITGVAPKIAVPTLLYIILAVVMDSLTKPLFTITQNNYSTLVVIGVLLILIGVVLVSIVGRELVKSYKSTVLMTSGLYKVFRNPMYTAYLIFIMPGISILFNSWLVLSSVILNFILFQVFIKEEYKYLEKTFGEEYKRYLTDVWFKFL